MEFEALFLVEINSCEEQSHSQEDEDVDLKLVREEDGADEGGEDVGRGRAVLLHHIVQLLQDGRHHQASDTAEQEAQHKEDLHLVGGRAQVLEDDAGAKVGGRDDMDKTGHYHPVQIKPELLVQEVLSGILNKKMLDVKFL